MERSCFYSHEDSWYNKEHFALECGTPCWLLIQKTPVEISTRKNWEEQLELLKPTEQVPEALQVVYGIILYYMLTGVRLFEDVYVRTSSLSSAGRHVSMGSFGSVGLDFDGCYDFGRSYDLAISSSRKF